MRLPITLTSSKRKYKAEIPTGWTDVSVIQYFDILRWLTTDKDPIDKYSILTGLDYNVMFNCET
jgi:hypothetical protein